MQYESPFRNSLHQQFIIKRIPWIGINTAKDFSGALRFSHINPLNTYNTTTVGTHGWHIWRLQSYSRLDQAPSSASKLFVELIWLFTDLTFLSVWQKDSMEQLTFSLLTKVINLMYHHLTIVSTSTVQGLVCWAEFEIFNLNNLWAFSQYIGNLHIYHLVQF